MRTKHTAIWAIVIVVLMVWSCNDSPTGPSTPTTQDLVGTWILRTIHSAGSLSVASAFLTIDTSWNTTTTTTDDSNWLRFNTDSTYSAAFDSATAASAIPDMGMDTLPTAAVLDTGSWFLAGNYIRLVSLSSVVSGTPDTLSAQVSLNGSQLTVSYAENISETTNVSGLPVTINGNVNLVLTGTQSTP